MLRIRELREERSVTQQEVAQKIGVSRQVYANWENEINQPDFKMLILLAEYFGVTTDFLLGRTDDFGNVVLPAEPTILSGEAELLHLFRGMNSLQREKFIAYGEGLTESKSFK